MSVVPPTFVGLSGPQAINGLSFVTLNPPTSSAGDLLLTLVVTSGEDPGDVEGWARSSFGENLSGLKLHLYWRFADGQTDTFVSQTQSWNHAYSVMLAFRDYEYQSGGMGAFAYLTAKEFTSTGEYAAPAGLETAVPQTRLLNIFATARDANTFSPSAQEFGGPDVVNTDIVVSGGTSLGNGSTLYIQTGIKTTAGEISPLPSVTAPASSEAIGLFIGVQPELPGRFRGKVSFPVMDAEVEGRFLLFPEVEIEFLPFVLSGDVGIPLYYPKLGKIDLGFGAFGASGLSHQLRPPAPEGVYSTLYPANMPDGRILPLRVNWSSPYRVSLAFKTDVIDAAVDGTEQRQANRSEPRKTIEFLADVHGEGRRALERHLASWQAQRTFIPDSTRFVATLGMGRQGTSISYRGVTPPWLSAGRRVVLVYKDQMETRTIASASGGVARFHETSFAEWPVGTRIHFILEGRISAEQRLRNLTSDVATLNVSFEVEPGTDAHFETDGGEFVGAWEVFNRRPNWASPIDVDHLYPRETVDFDIGRRTHHIPRDYPTRIIRAEHLARSSIEAFAVADFFIRQKGRLREFLLPSGSEDVPYMAALGGSPLIMVSGTDFAAEFADSPVYRRIAFRMRDGTTIHRLVRSITANESTGVSIIETTVNLPDMEISPRTCLGISWVYSARLASDRLDIDWLTDEVAQFALSFQTLRNFEL